MTASPASTPFVFDTEFDATGVVVQTSAFRPTKRAWTPAEVETLLAEARLEARNVALAEAESLQAMALSAIGEALTAAVPALTRIATARIHARGEAAFLHAVADHAATIRLYESLGYRVRARLDYTVFAAPRG